MYIGEGTQRFLELGDFSHYTYLLILMPRATLFHVLVSFARSSNEVVFGYDTLFSVKKICRYCCYTYKSF